MDNSSAVGVLMPRLCLSFFTEFNMLKDVVIGMILIQLIIWGMSLLAK